MVYHGILWESMGIFSNLLTVRGLFSKNKRYDSATLHNSTGQQKIKNWGYFLQKKKASKI